MGFRVYIERIQREKANGATVNVGIHPSKVVSSSSRWTRTARTSSTAEQRDAPRLLARTRANTPRSLLPLPWKPHKLNSTNDCIDVCSDIVFHVPSLQRNIKNQFQFQK